MGLSFLIGGKERTVRYQPTVDFEERPAPPVYVIFPGRRLCIARATAASGLLWFTRGRRRGMLHAGSRFLCQVPAERRQRADRLAGHRSRGAAEPPGRLLDAEV